MKNTLLLGLGLMLPCIAASAAESNDSTEMNSGKKIEFARTSPEVKEILDRTRPQGAGTIPTPKFVIKSGDNKFLMTIGGQINLIVGGDMGNDLYKQSGAGISFVTNQIPVPAVAGHKSDIYIDPLYSQVDLQVVGLAGSKNEVTGYVKFGTSGNNTSVQMMRAYVTWRGFTGGQKLTLFQDDYACQPPTIDPEGPSGEVSAVSYELSYKSPSYHGFRYAVGLDLPTYYSASGRYKGHDFMNFENQLVTSDVNQVIPDIPMWVEYSFSTWNRIRLSGMIRNFAYRDLIAAKTRHSVGWGVMLSGNVQPSSQWTLYYQAAYGAGIGNYIQDIAGHPYSFTPNDDNPGHMKPSPMLGANIGVSFNPTKKLQFNAMFSEARIWGVSAYANAGEEINNYKYALYGAVNCFYTINSFLQVGAEYLYGHRQTWNMGGANDSRLQAELSFTF